MLKIIYSTFYPWIQKLVKGHPAKDIKIRKKKKKRKKRERLGNGC